MKRIIIFLFLGLLFAKSNTYAQCEEFGDVTFTTANTFNINGSSNVSITTAGTYLIQGNGTASVRTVTVNLTSATTVTNIYLCNVNIVVTGTAFTITRGTVNLHLGGTNTLTSGGTNAGLLITSGANGGILTINGPGKLTATGSNGGAGIGGSAPNTHGPITIVSGEINAIGGGGTNGGGAGIGGGGANSNNSVGGSSGTITISGGTVTATGGSSTTANIGGGAGIGSGGGNNRAGGTVSANTISITGGVVTVTGGTGPSGKGAGIGVGGGAQNSTGNGAEYGTLSPAQVTPANLEVTQGVSSRLTASATVTPPRVLNYQWYSNTAATNTGGTAISGAKSASFDVPTNSTGTFYYYCVISSGNFTPQSTSAVTVKVIKPIEAQEPVITEGSPANLSVFVGDKDDEEDGVVLAVEAEVTDGGKLTYQWYKAVDENDEDGEPTGDETEDSYIVVPTDKANIYYYYVVVTNFNDNVEEDDDKTRSVKSGIAKVEVSLNPCDITGNEGIVEVPYSGKRIDLTTIDDLFDVPVGAGSRIYTLKSGTENGSITGNILTITGLGTFEITLETKESVSHEAGGPAVATLEVLPKTLTITGSFNTTNRTYNGTNEVVLSGNATLNEDDIIEGDQVALATPRIGLMNNANAGNAKQVTSIKLSGVDIQFYKLPVSGLTVDIAKKELEIKGFITKVLGSSTVDFSKLSLLGVLEGDDVEIDPAGVIVTYVDEEYGVDNDINFSGPFGLKGEEAGNYTIAVNPPTDIKGRITWALQKPLVITPAHLEVAVGKTGEFTFTGGDTGNDLIFTYSPSDKEYIAANEAVGKILVTAKNIGDVTLKVTMPGEDEVFEPVSASVTVKVIQGTMEFPATGPINTVYTPNLTLANMTLPAGYAWNTPATPLNAGTLDHDATYTDPSGNYLPVGGKVKVIVAKATLVNSADVQNIKKDVLFNSKDPQSENLLNAKVGVDNKLLSVVIQPGGTPTYKPEILTGNIIAANPTVNNSGILSFSIKDGSQAGQTATISVVLSFTNYEDITVKVDVTLVSNEIKVESVTLNKNKLELEIDKTETLVVTVKPDGATNKNVKWESNKPEFATVSDNGLVTAKAEGKAIITVTTLDGSNKSAQCEVTVIAPAEVEADTPFIKKQPTSKDVEIGVTYDLTVEASVNDNGELSYQWFKNASNETPNGTAIANATKATYAAPIDKAGTYYYYVVVTNTLTVNDKTKTATTTSSIVTLTVKEAPKPTGEVDIISPNLNVYPNPFTGALRIVNAEGCMLRVISGNGTVVHTQKIGTPDETIQLEHLSAGIYFLRVEKDNQSKTIKVIKN